MSNQMIRLSAPCSHWDIEAMQTWLEDMSMEGLLLAKRAGFGGGYLFQRIEPLEVRYRLTPVANRLEEWNKAPDAEPRSVADAYGWDYVCTLGLFHVYRSYNREDRELNTDPAVLAESLYQLRRGAILRACTVLLWPLAYFAVAWMFSGPDMLWRTLIRDGVIFYSFLPVAAVFLTIRGLLDTIALLRLHGRWKQGRLPVERKDWRKRARVYRIGIRAVYVAAFCLIFLSNGYRHSIREQMRYQDLPETADVPFATVMELAAEAGMEAERNEVGYLREWSHFLSPVNYEWAEIVDVTAPDGTVGRVSIEVRYHVLRNEWLADRLTAEYLAEADDGTPMEMEAEGFETARFYLDSYDNPAAVLRQGNTVVRVSFPREDIDDDRLKLAHWIECLEIGE